MSSQNYAVVTYGIIIPMDNSNLYQHVIEQLISKHQNLYQDCNKEELDFLFELQATDNQYTIAQDVEDLCFVTLAGCYESIYSDDVLILMGYHDTPTLYSSPFKSKEDCINRYKQQFGDLLPTNFDYENNIGGISYVVYG